MVRVTDELLLGIAQALVYTYPYVLYVSCLICTYNFIRTGTIAINVCQYIFERRPGVKIG